jgi:hypothetical protein
LVLKWPCICGAFDPFILFSFISSKMFHFSHRWQQR